MAKVGRNEPCSCGSGLKFKRCHGSVVSPARDPGNLPLKATATIAGQMGFPGQHQDIHIINRFKQGDARNSIPVEGIPGAYQVTFVLSRPGYSLVPEGSYSFSGGLEGDSHLAIAKPAFMAPGNENANEIVVVCATEDGHFVFRGVPNKSGFLGKLISEPFNANSRRDAEERAFRSLSPSLSNWTVHLDVPLEICQRETREIATDNIQTSIVTPHFRAPFSVLPTVQLPPEFRGLASLYREALNTSSVVYQFLCLYKIVEALRARRKRLQRAAKKSGTPCSSPIEVLPGTEKEIAAWLRSLFYARPDWDLFAIQSAVPVELRGQDMAFVIDSVLKPLRDQVAHALTTPKGDLTLSADELLHARQVVLRLPTMKCIVRRMLKNDFPSDFLSHLPDQ